MASASPFWTAAAVSMGPVGSLTFAVYWPVLTSCNPNDDDNSACMQTQHKIQLDRRDVDPSLVQPLHPLMAPVVQTADKARNPQYAAPYAAPPPAGYPAAQPAHYAPPPR